MPSLSFPVQQFATANKLPCSSLVAAWVLDRLGQIPKQPKKMDNWFALNRPLWKAINLWDLPVGTDSNIAQIQSQLGGTIQTVISAGQLNPPPTLRRRHWHIVQRWCGSNGHSFLVHVDGQDNIVVVDSSTTKGLTITEKENSQWYGKGCTLTVLTVPNITKKKVILILIPGILLFFLLRQKASQSEKAFDYRYWPT